MPNIRGVSHIIYKAWDRDQAIKFFVEAAGGQLQPRGDIIYVALGDVLIEMGHRSNLEVADDAENGDNYMFGIEVDDLEAAIEHFKQFGSKVLHDIWNAKSFWGRQAVITVPGGLPMALREYRAPDGPHFIGWTAEGSGTGKF